MTCGSADGVRITQPGVGAEVSDGTMSIAGEVKGSIDPATVRLEINGVDLIGGLGLVYPFLDESGTLEIGSDTVTVSSFDFEPPASGTTRIFVDVSGLSAGSHDVLIEGLRLSDGEPRQGQRTVKVAPALGLAAARN